MLQAFFAFPELARGRLSLAFKKFEFWGGALSPSTYDLASLFETLIEGALSSSTYDLDTPSSLDLGSNFYYFECLLLRYP